jgi:hypothetical protein
MDTSIREKIERRAYEIYLRRGSTHGSHEDDWAQAEKEIMAELKKKEPTPTQKVEKEPPASKVVEKPSVPELQPDLFDVKDDKQKRTRSIAASSDTTEAPAKKRVAKKKSAA